MAFVTDSNRPQPLWQPPPTACPTASGAASEAPSLLTHSCPSPIHPPQLYVCPAPVLRAQVAPKRAALAEAEAELSQVKAKLAETRASLQAVESSIDELERTYEDAINKQTELKEQVQQTEVKLVQANKLIGGLSGEKDRWKVLWPLRHAPIPTDPRALPPSRVPGGLGGCPKSGGRKNPHMGIYLKPEYLVGVYFLGGGVGEGFSCLPQISAKANPTLQRQTLPYKGKPYPTKANPTLQRQTLPYKGKPYPTKANPTLQRQTLPYKGKPYPTKANPTLQRQTLPYKGKPYPTKAWHMKLKDEIQSIFICP